MRAGGRSFVSAFYDKLLQASEEIGEKFKHIDMETQIDVLAHAIVMSFLFIDKNHHGARHSLNEARVSHSRHNLDVQPHLYDIWMECMIETVRELDPHADEELLEDWHKVMLHAVEHVRSGY